MTRGEFHTLQMSVGFNYNSHGILADMQPRPLLLPASVLTFDPMHCFCSNGTMSVAIFLFLQRCKSVLSIGYSELAVFFGADWQFPRHTAPKGKAMAEVFSPSRERASAETFKASASEVLMIYPVLLHFASTVVAASGRLREEIDCLRALCAVLDLWLAAKRGRPDQSFSTAITTHFNLFVRVYGPEHVKPKHHYVSPGSASTAGWCAARCLHIGKKAPSRKESGNSHEEYFRFRKVGVGKSAT